MSRTALRDAIETKMKASLMDGKLPCAVCFQIAREFNITPKEIGELANKLNTRISKCQMGLFP